MSTDDRDDIKESPKITLLQPEEELEDDGLDGVPIPFTTEGVSSGEKKDSPTDSQAMTASSSQQTNSDKLTDLPSSTSSPRFRQTHWPIHHAFDSRSNSGGTHTQIPSARSEGDLQQSVGNGHSSPKFPTRGGSHSRRASLIGTYPRAARSEESVSSLDTPKNKVAFGSGSLSSLQNVKQVFQSRKKRSSDPSVHSPAAGGFLSPDTKPSEPGSAASPRSRSHSKSPSRATSPLRIFQQWSQGLYRAHLKEEPFVPVNPFKFNSHRFQVPCFPSGSHEDHSPPQLPLDSSNLSDHIHQHCNCQNVSTCFCLPLPITSHPHDDNKGSLADFLFLLTDTIPRQAYLYMLFRIPAMYFSRVARVFEDAEVSKPDIQRIIESFQMNDVYSPFSTSSPLSLPPDNNHGIGAGIASALGHAAHVGSAPVTTLPLPYPEDWSPPLVSPTLIRFKHSWENFIDSLLREWKTLNLVSALLLSAILTVFQIPNAESDPIIRNIALLSLTCALMSLCYGCVYIVRFGTMRSMFRASRWAEEARKNNTLIWWNVWVMLAMPAIWLAWAMILFVTTILCFVWRTGADNDPDERDPLPQTVALGPRITITAVFLLGVVYFALIVKTLKSYGSSESGPYQQKWKRFMTSLEPGEIARRGGVPMTTTGNGGNYFNPQSSPRVAAAMELDELTSERRGRDMARRGTPTNNAVRPMQVPPILGRPREKTTSDANARLYRDSPRPSLGQSGEAAAGLTGLGISTGPVTIGGV